jgi:predicted GNAT family acetyltransferase
MSSQTVTVAHEPENYRFVVVQDGETAELTYRGRTDSQIVFTHTSVPSALEGRGIGGALAKAGLEYARANNLEVVPLCSFVRGYIERKPEYQPLVRKSADNSSGSNSGGFA